MGTTRFSQFKETLWLELCDGLLDRLRGKINLVQAPEERQQLVRSVFKDLYDQSWRDRLPQLHSEDTQRDFLQYFLSYDPIEEFLQDALVEDIMINSTEAVFVRKTGEGLVRAEYRFETSRELDCFVKKLVVFSGRTQVELINDLELANVRGRANIVYSPFGPQITITRAKERPLSILEIIASGTLTYRLAAQLWMYVEGLSLRPANVIIAGGPGTGKTTLLNAMLSFVPTRERIVVIEDTLELNTKFLENCVRLESSARVSTEALVRNSLRMRPDRILVGEVRGAEAHDLMTVVNLGRYCLGTLHASSVRETVIRLENWPMEVPTVLISLVDAFIILKRLAIDGRVIRIVDEVMETAGMEREKVLLSPAWSYDRKQRQLVESASPSSVFRDRLAEATGLSSAHVMQETARRAVLLRWMDEKFERSDIDAMSRFFERYRTHPDHALAELQVTAKALDAEAMRKGDGIAHDSSR